MTDDETFVKSPCVRTCTLDEDGACIGCLRTVDEIKAWGGLAPEEKRAMLAVLDGRRRTGARPGLTPPS